MSQGVLPPRPQMRRWSGLIAVLRTPSVDERRIDEVRLTRHYPLPLASQPDEDRAPRVAGRINTVATAGRLVLAWGDTTLAPGSYTCGVDLAEIDARWENSKGQTVPDDATDLDQYKPTAPGSGLVRVLAGTLIGVTVHGPMDRPGRLDLWPGQPTEIEVEP